MAIFGDFFASCVFSEHLKFALRPHHVWKWQTSDLRPLRLSEEIKKIERRKNKRQDENIMVCPIP